MKKALVHKKYKLQKFPGKGGWTFAAIPEIVPDKKNPFGWVKVKGFIDDVPVADYHLMPMGNGQLFLPVKAAIRKQINKKEGDWITVHLFADNDPVEIPEELLLCLKDEPAAFKKFMALTDNEKATIVKSIFTVKKAETRAAKIIKLIGSLFSSKSI